VTIVAAVAVVAATAASSSAAAATAAARPFGELDAHAFAVEAFAVEFLNGVFGVANIFEFDEAEASLEDDVAKSPVPIEEPFQVGLASARREPSDENSSSHVVMSAVFNSQKKC